MDELELLDHILEVIDCARIRRNIIAYEEQRARLDLRRRHRTEVQTTVIGWILVAFALMALVTAVVSLVGASGVPDADWTIRAVLHWVL